MYSGPTGFGLRGEAVGCASILQQLELSHEKCTRLSECAVSLENHLFGDDNVNDTALDDLVSLCGRFELAAKAPE